MDSKQRCSWVTDDPIYIEYHDKEWGRPVYDDRKLFEMLCLEGAQAGLSWITILRRRENYQEAFNSFQVEKISQYDASDVERLVKNEGIIRNRRKIESVIKNAKAVLQIREHYGTFSAYIWKFVDGKPIINQWKDDEEVPNQSEQSIAMSKDLKKRGFSFVGPVICYAFMQATGMVNDHTSDCFLHNHQK
ncbi:DNA-3-methyladenine glycosylase I [Cerasibacillus terrae]|uniref:DNA-3-methyladenine glycosylase I n=2 Tax=Cerasibacillus terrae TaxID=2498845 RepID=A0A5C8NLH9_9BACI|nr:DNA-3-methyladenine glycosylase I [Cerasibacillus terrae]TXL61755.1 DNA-3-methyladenine glycosylase I [Cerasibacillus terrae]